MLQVLINGEEFLCDKNITIKEDFLSPSSTILNNCYPKSWEENRDYLTEFFYVKDYSKWEIYYDNELLFAGVVKNSGNISLNPRQPHFASFQVLDYKTFLSEGTTLDFVIANKTVTEAEKILKEAGFKTKISITGDKNDTLVTDQTPKPGSKIPEDSIIMLYSEENDTRVSVKVPDFKGKSLSQARNMASSNNLNITYEGTGTVISQSITVDTSVEEGTIIELKLSTESGDDNQ